MSFMFILLLYGPSVRVHFCRVRGSEQKKLKTHFNPSYRGSAREQRKTSEGIDTEKRRYFRALASEGSRRSKRKRIRFKYTPYRKSHQNRILQRGAAAAAPISVVFSVGCVLESDLFSFASSD